MAKVTWQEMFNYLKLQDNCSIHGKGFFVNNMNDCLDKLGNLIDQHEPIDRKGNVYCKSIKGSLEKVYYAHKEGLTSEVGHKPKRYFSTFNND